MEKLNISGIKISNLNTQEFLELLLVPNSRARTKKVLYVNAHSINIASQDYKFKDIINNSDILYVDGWWVVWLSRLLGKPLKERISAGDFFDIFINKCIEEKKSLYFLGGGCSLSQELSSVLGRKYPALLVAGLSPGYFGLEEESKIVDKINQSKPDILLVGMGSPRQEYFIARNASRLEADFVWAVGGLFNLLSGRSKPAPFIMKRLGLEWLFRLFQEPGRLWKRYLFGNAVFLYRALVEIMFHWLNLDKEKLVYNIIKRAIDIFLSLVMIFLLSPLFILISLGIILDSCGPALFLHKRVGKGGKEFIIYKFRTLLKSADPYMEKPNDSDACISRFGRFLRKSYLDELPQLFNVLKGDMSLVGPRPEMPFIVDRYNAEQRKRLLVTPGITGLWQINRPQNIYIHANLEFDQDYIKNRSTFLDAVIFLKTVIIPFSSMKYRLRLWGKK